MRVWLVLAMLMITGCRKSDEAVVVRTSDGTVAVEGEKINIRTKDGTATIESNEGTMRIQTNDGTMTIGGSDIPAGFPIPVMPGSKVENSAHMTQPDGQEIFQLTCTASGEAKAVADFYEKAFKDNGVTVTRTEQSYDGNVNVMLYGESDTAEATAMVIKEPQEVQTTTTISWSVRKK